MSGIFGLLHLDGKPAARERLQTMRDAMAYWGPDGSNIWHEGSVGLGSLWLYNTPEAAHERVPRESPDGRLVMTAEARIDNRAELFEALRVPVPERRQMPDSELMLRAYERWGEACVHHLLGDWSFAIWDKQERQLFLARDHHGNTALYYYAGPRGFAFASCLKALLALPEVPKRLNELKLAQILTAWPAEGFPTIYADICALPPAHTLTVSEGGVRTQRYWRLEDVAELHFKRHEDYVEGLLETFAEAVRCRLRSYRPVGVTLSGGLDSGSVSVVAARELRAGGERLPAFSAVPMYDVRETQGKYIGDETPFITATAQRAGNIDVHFIRAEQTTPLAGMRRALYVHDSPVHAAGNFFWMADLLRTAQAQGIGTLLTGQGGNGSISWTGRAQPSFFDLLRRRRWHAATRRLVWHCLPVPVRQSYHHWRAGEAPWERYSAIHPDFARRLKLGPQMAAAGHDPTFSGRWLSPRALRTSLTRPGRGSGGARWAEMGAGYGIEVRDPTLDQRVLEYCFSVPDAVFRGPDGSGRWLIRRAMGELLPATVRDNAQLGTQAADLVQRLQAEGSEIEQLLRRLEQSPAAGAYLAVGRMRETWQAARLTANSQTQSDMVTILTRGMQVGLFLLSVDREPIDLPRQFQVATTLELNV